MAMKLAQQDRSKDVQEQLDDLYRNQQLIAREMDKMLVRIKELEDSAETGDVILTERQ
jgi:hypothetical protein